MGKTPKKLIKVKKKMKKKPQSLKISNQYNDINMYLNEQKTDFNTHG